MKLFTVIMLCTFLALGACDKESREHLSAINKMTDAMGQMDNSADDRYGERCVDLLGQEENQINDIKMGQMTLAIHKNRVSLFNNCLKELAIYIDSKQTQFKKNGVDQCVDWTETLKAELPKMEASIEKLKVSGPELIEKDEVDLKIWRQKMAQLPASERQDPPSNYVMAQIFSDTSFAIIPLTMMTATLTGCKPQE